ncbi:hypothetical protein BOTCAL_0274g00140 [Botryotinia calthae]|uniref:Sodium/calcium exchanger membrane region domain-containing protein n=1 Tax=Botryotinia calthae TaxID=38488 RepID=A0A4Y8CY81_9HELO|nr:hypothetical protein BOTCAL_0274g00140 [Botryotinia calthae]
MFPITHVSGFRKALRRNSWAHPVPVNDVEAARNIIDEGLSRFKSAPTVSRTNVYQESTNSKGKLSSSLEDLEFSYCPRSQRPISIEEGARRRFIERFTRKGRELNESEERRRKGGLFKGTHTHHQQFTLRNQLDATIMSSWVNMLLIAVPIGIALNYTNVSPVAVFVVNFIAVFPVAALIGIAMDDLRRRTGDIVGALVYMSFGNIVQTITSIFLLKSRQLATLKTSLVGGILTLILLNNGVAFMVGGLRRVEQFYNALVATVFNGLLSVSVVAFIIPTASFYLSGTAVSVITKQSRGMSILLIFVYALYLFFEMRTHAIAFMEESQKVPKKHGLPKGAVPRGIAKAGAVGAGIARANFTELLPKDELVDLNAIEIVEEDVDTWLVLQLYVCLGTLVFGTAILAVNTQFMTDSIQGLTEKANVPRDFIGMILLPILSNDTMAIQCASKDQMDMAIQSALGKSIQTALVVAPTLVLVGWGMGLDDMNLLFDGFQVSALFVSILLAQQSIADGKSLWLKGAILTMTYVMIAIASWFQGSQSVV